MPVIRSTFFFSDSNGAGWSETIYLNVANLTVALATAKRLVPLRVELLGKESGLRSLRVSDDLIKRDSQIYPVPPGDQRPIRGSQSEHASNDLVIRLEGGVTFKTRRTLALRGIPTNITGGAGVYVGNATWNRAFERYVESLKTDHWAIRFRDKTVPTFGIIGVAQNVVTGITLIQTALPCNYLPGDQVFIRGVQGAIQVNGLWTVIASPDVDKFTIKVDQLVGAYIPSGVANKNNYLLAEILEALIIRSNTHKAGVPFDQLRGRRRARSRR